MAKSKTSSYILTLPLNTEKYQEDELNKRFEKCRKIYNSCITELFKRYNHMIESKDYQKNVKSKSKDRNKIFNELNNKYGLSEYSLHRFVVNMYNYFNIDSKTAQALATRAFNAFQKYMFHQAKRVNYIKYNELYSIEGKTNAQGIKYRDGYIRWNKLSIPTIIRNNDIYAQTAIQNRVKYCRIVKKEIKGKIKFYVQLIMEGVPPTKVNKDGELKGQIGQSNVGIDMGTRTIAYSSKYDVKLLELAPNVNNINREIKLIQRKMDRSRKSMNPNKYNENGTIKQGNKDKWIYSNHYMKLKSQKKELYRKESEIRKQDHYKMINELLILGDKFYVETMQFKGLQRRSNKTEKNNNGKFKKKKRFGKSLANKAPSMFLTMLDNKLKWNGNKLYKIDTFKCRASQYNHFTGEYHKKELKDRWNEDIKIQRDMYSAFLIMNVKGNLKEIDRDKCIETYDNFKILHDKEINRLKEIKNNGIKLISSMGI